MVDKAQKFGPTIRGIKDKEKDTKLFGLEFDVKPFGEVNVPKAGGRGKSKKEQLIKIKGLQQFDISNNHGVIFCANDKILQVFCGEKLNEEA